MGKKEAVKVNPPGAAICWYQSLQKKNDFKNKEIQGEEARAIYCNIHLVIFDSSHKMHYFTLFLRICKKA
jgi:hypothetical protein